MEEDGRRRYGADASILRKLYEVSRLVTVESGPSCMLGLFESPSRLNLSRSDKSLLTSSAWVNHTSIAIGERSAFH
jgi:hypothetical protein